MTSEDRYYFEKEAYRLGVLTDSEDFRKTRELLKWENNEPCIFRNRCTRDDLHVADRLVQSTWNVTMKKSLPWILFAVLMTLALLLAVPALTGCKTGPNENQCATWEKAVQAYEIALAAGHKPSEDETRIAAAAAALISVYCGGPDSASDEAAGISGRVVRDLRVDSTYRQPESFSYQGGRYDRVVPITMVYVGDRWWQTPPVYRMTRTSTMWVPCDAWVSQSSQDPEFKEVKHE